MEIALYAVGVLVFAVALLFSIAAHEAGHMFFAKRFGGYVSEFFVGFGPKIWSKKKGETEYGFKWVPLGGYVKILGMVPKPKDEEKPAKTIFGQIAQKARKTEWKDSELEDEKRAFFNLDWKKKVGIIAAGPVVNLILAFLLFFGLFAIYGERSENPTLEVSEITQCIIPETETYNEDVCSDYPTAPAYESGIQPGDVMVSFNGEKLEDWNHFGELTHANGDQPLTLEVLRDGEIITLDTETQPKERYINSNYGNDSGPADWELKTVGYFGVSSQMVEVRERKGPFGTISMMGGMIVETGKVVMDLPSKVNNVFMAITGKEERAMDTPVSVVGGGKFAGEVVTLEEEGVAAGEKIGFLISLIASFNLFLFLFNLLPIPPLDGGHIAGAVYEGIKKNLAKLFKRPEPAPFDASKLMPLAYIITLIFLGFGLLLIVGDIVAPISLTG